MKINANSLGLRFTYSIHRSLYFIMLLAMCDALNGLHTFHSGVYRFLVVQYPATFQYVSRWKCITEAGGTIGGRGYILRVYRRFTVTAALIAQYANVALTIDRYLAITRATAYRTWNHRRHAINTGIACILVYFISAIITSVRVEKKRAKIVAIQIDTSTIDIRVFTCVVTDSSTVLFRYYWMLSCNVVAVTMITFVLLLARALKKLSPPPGQNVAAAKNHHERMVRVY